MLGEGSGVDDVSELARLGTCPLCVGAGVAEGVGMGVAKGVGTGVAEGVGTGVECIDDADREEVA